MSIDELPNPDEYSRKPYLGDKITYGQYAKIVASLLQGNKMRNERPLKINEIAEKLGIDRKTIRKFRDLAIHLRLGEFDEQGNFIKPKLTDAEKFETFTDKESFCNNSEIQKWISKNDTKRQGKPLASLQSRINQFKHVCNTLQVPPSAFISGDTVLLVLENSDELVGRFVKLYKDGKSTVKTNGNSDLEHIRYSYAQAVRSFMSAFGYQYPKNWGGNMGQNVKPFHGLYADVKLTPEQIAQAKSYLIENYGLDSDVFRWFFFGLESCARKMAIKNCKSTFKVVKFIEREALVLEVFESKTQQLKKGIYKKYITDDELKESIRLVSKRSDYIIEDRTDSAIKKIYTALKKLYQHLQVDKLWLTDRDDINSGYFMKHSTHALRHCGCQLWLSRLGFAAISLVAMMGGWNTMDEARASYGAISDEELLDEVGRTWK